LQNLYQGDYVDATYGDKLAQTYDKIMALPTEHSDNRARVEHVHHFALPFFKKPSTVLDVGSGLCVFLAGMKEKGWQGWALDPDARAALHAKTKVQVEAIHATFEHFVSPQKFHLISFNKVLEHVVDPAAFLAKAKQHLAPHGLIYVELPDGESAVQGGPEREEFFIDHHHIFSLASLSLLAYQTNYRVLQITRLQEPSTKYTLRAFLSTV
jgi:2-polyprenyl-3-methyl-5-hydroxy-6-metoxy-1,4-benzoquinol methylase